MTPPRPRVAMLGAFPPQAQGIQEYCREVAETVALVADVHAIGFRHMYPACLFPGVKAAMDPDKPPLHAPGVTVEHRLAWYNPPGWLLRAARVPCDIFHLQWWSLPLLPVSAAFLQAMRLRRRPVVVTVHNVLPHEASRGFLRASRWVCRRADRVIIHSQANRDQLLDHYGLPDDHVVHIPMGFAGAPLPAPSAVEARAALGLDPARRYLLSFGTIRPYKGVLELLEAFAAVAGRFTDTDLIIAGKPWEDWAPYEARIRALGIDRRVHTWIGYQPENRVPLLYGAADLLVLPYTHFDAQSAVGAQALGYGVPMLVSTAGGLPEWVDREPAWCVPPADPPALAAALAAYLDHAPARAAAWRTIADRVRERLGRPAIARAYDAVYRPLL